jgi:uncharacterized membrane protein YjjP (DUF1212 family)
VLTTDGEPLAPVEPATGPDPHGVLQLAMRIGDQLLAAGMSANDVVLFVLKITSACGLEGVHVDVTYTSLSASFLPAPGRAPITAIRVVRPTEVDYTRVRRLLRLVQQIERGMPVTEAAPALERIRSAPHPYPRWLSLVGNAGVGPAVSLLFTTDWKILLLTFVSGCLVDLLLAWFDRRRVPPFFRQLTAAGLITLVAAGVTYAGDRGVSFFIGLDPTLVVVGGIVMLLAGVMIVGAMQDAIDQFYVTASARVFEVFMRTGGIVAGIVAGVALAHYLGAPLTISAEPIALGPLSAQFAAAALIAAMFAISVYADAVTIALSSTMALLGWAAFIAARELNLTPVPANMVAALVAALLVSLIVRRTQVPGFGLITAALLPLVPGLAIYQGLLQLVGTEAGAGDPSAGGSTLLLALGVAAGIGAGASLGIYLGRPIAATVRRITFRSRRRQDRAGAGA